MQADGLGATVDAAGEAQADYRHVKVGVAAIMHACFLPAAAAPAGKFPQDNPGTDSHIE